MTPEWQEEKRALLATIRRKEQEAHKLGKRFKLLQQTLREQQKLLDRYQRTLGEQGVGGQKSDKTAIKLGNKSSVKRSHDVLQPIATSSVNVQPPMESKPESKPWMTRKSPTFSNTVEKRPTINAEDKTLKETTIDKTSRHRKRTHLSGLAATWAEEKRRMQKKPKWEKQQNHSTRLEKITEEEKQQEQKESFAYVEVVRNQEERAAMPAHDCMECKKYYDALGGLGSPTAGAAQMDKCSRHRARFEPYQTPDDFWRLSFPDSQHETTLPPKI